MSREVLLLRRQAPQYAILLIILLLLAFLLDNLVFGPCISGLIGNYLLPTFMWSVLAVIIYHFPESRPAAKMRQQGLIRWLAVLCILIAVLAYMVEGCISGFGTSPYDHTPAGLIINIVSGGIGLIAVEMARAWLMNRYFGKRPFWGIPLLAFLFTCFSLTVTQIINLKSAIDATKFVGMNFLPNLGQSLLATCLAYLGGPLPAIVYRAGLMIFERIVPVLPSSNWANQTLLHTLAPILGLMLTMQIYREENRQIRDYSGGNDQLGWLLTALAAIMIIWFSLGVFSYSPRVILSGSMQPGINIGDIVIIKEIKGEQAQIGDIIMFPMGSMKVTHRVIGIQQRDGKKYFITKGDANPEPEPDPVPEQNVKGKVVTVIPQIGKFTLWLRGG